MQIKQFDVVLDIKTRDVTYQDTATKKNINSIEFVKDDSLANQLNICLFDGDKPYELEGNIVNIIFRKYDGNFVVMDEDSKGLGVEGNVVNCILSNNTIAIPGRRVQGEVTIYGKNGEKLTTTSTFEFRVKRPLMEDSDIKSVDDFPLLVRLIARVDTLLLDLEPIAQDEHERIANEEGRIALYKELQVLQTTLEDLKLSLVDMVEDEKDRQENEKLREELKNKLVLLQVELQNNIFNANGTIKIMNETIDKTNSVTTTAEETIKAFEENENVRKANEEDRIVFHKELKSLQNNLSVLADNLINIVNDESTRQTNEIARENLKGELELIQAELEGLIIKASNSIEDTKEATNKANMARESIDSLSNEIKQNEELRKLAENERAMNTQAISIEEEERKLAEKNRENNFASALDAFIEETERVESEYPERLNKLESIRTHKGDIEPSDTIFWYDTRKEM